ncbi:MAG: hypothetical protein RL593_816 [Pseudomonadota bacterium]|jgi:hypothetical protein
MPQLTLYGTSACHLCEDAEQIIRAALPTNLANQLIVKDITDHDELYNQYQLTIPVLNIQPNNIELHWPFTVNQVIELLIQHGIK